MLGPVLVERSASVDLMGITLHEGPNGNLKIVGHRLCLFVSEPDVARGAGAAIAALRTGKTKAIGIPLIFQG